MGKVIKNKIRGLSWTAKISLVLCFSLLISVFMYQGWYGPYSVSAASATKIYSFTGGSEGWAGVTGTFTTTAYSANTLTATISGRAKTNAGVGWQLLDVTWESLGVPAGATVTAVDGSYDWQCSTYATGAPSSAGDLTITDSADGNIITLETGDTFTGTTSMVTKNAAAAVAVPAAIQASDSTIRIKLLGTLATGANNGASVVRVNDNVSLTITYTVTAPVMTLPTATSVSSTSATLGATVSASGGDPVTARGTVWGTATNPTGNILSEGGTATGAFSHARSSLTAGTKIYYRGYATNGLGTSYSPTGSFYTEPATQASNVTFSGVSATGMTVNWTRGSGNGVIVLMKATSAVTGAPADGTYTTYTPNSVFGSGTLIGDGWVVYKGTGTSVAVTGLTNGTTYYVSVFEFAGTIDTAGDDLGTNYIATSPATGSRLAQTATDSTPPTVGTITVTPTSTTYTSGSPTITATLTDAESAASSCEYTVNGGATWTAGVVSGAASPYTCTASPTGLVGPVTINIRGTSAGGTGTGVAVTRTADGSAPVMSPPLIVAAGNGQNVISWSAASDPVSGVKQYDLRYVTGTTPPANCSAGTSIYTGSLLTFTHSPLTNGSDYSYRLCASDNVNNLAAGITGTGTPITGTANVVSAVRTLSASSATDSSSRVLMQTLTVNSSTVGGSDNKLVLFSLTMDDAGTATLISSVRVYIDPTSSGSLPSTAALIGGKSRWDGASTTILLDGGTVSDRTITSGTPKYLYIVYDMAFGQSTKTVQAHVTNIGAAAPDTSATVNLSSNSFTLTAGSGLAVNTTCGDCHNYPPADAIGGRNTPAGSVVGSHSAHSGNVCSSCHFVPVTETYADFDHRSGDIQMLTSVTYSRGSSFAQTNNMTGTGLGTCVTASCHGNVYGSGTATSPTWGTTAGCDACHSIAIGVNGPATGGHTTHAGSACTLCHNAGTTATTSPSTAHADGDVDVANVGYPANVAKHASGSGYSTCSAASCHANVYGTGASTTPVWGSTGNGCAACHSVVIGANGPATGSHDAHAGAACTSCHNTGTTATTAPSTGHTDGDIDVTSGYPLNVAKHAAGTYTGTCNNASCHANVYGTGMVTTPTWGNNAGCSACHTTPIGTSGPNTGSHAAHNEADCSQCHAGATNSTTVPTLNHADGDIDVTNGYPVTAKHAAGTYTGTCSTASCHADPYSAATATTPVWGSGGSGCNACHSAQPISVTGPATGAHTKHMGLTGAACIDCHNSGTTASTVPTTGHGDGNIDVTGGYPLNVTKHAAGTGYSTCTTSICHSSGQSTTGGATPVYATSPNWGTTGTTCGSCHLNFDSNASAPGDHVKHAQAYPFTCATCHNGYTETTVAAATHVNQTIELSFSGTLATGTAYSQGNGPVGNGYGTCSTSYCHSTGQSNTGAAAVSYPATPPTWGTTVTDCGSCHLNFDSNASAPGDHVKHAQTYPFTCATCHNGYTETTVATATHVNKTIELSFSGNATGTVYSGGTTNGNHAVGGGYGNCTTSYCHSTGQSATGGATPTYPGTAPVWGTTVTTCGSCHLDFDANASATGDHVKHAQGTANFACATCHTGYTESTVATSTHANKTIEVAITGTYAGGTYTGGTTPGNHAAGGGFGSCSATKCHGQGVPVWGGALYSAAVQCENCHGSATTNPFYSTAATGAAPTKVTAATDSKVGAHTIHLASASTGLSANIACSECHGTVASLTSPATHMDGATTFTWGTLAKTGSLNPSIVSGTCSSNYCHGGAMPGGDATGSDRTPLWSDTAYISATLDAATCGRCHGFPPSSASGHPAATAPGSFPTSNCNCHANISTTGSTLAAIFVDKSLHINGIYEPAASGCKGCHGSGSAKDMETEFAKNSHHTNKTWANITDADCVVCHAEGSIAAGSVSVVGTRHGNDTGTKGVVDLYNADNRATIYSLTLTDLTGRVHVANTTFDTFCMSCHDSNGAAAVTSGNGFTVGSATNPFNDATLSNLYDGQIRTFGAAPSALNVFDAFATTNNSHHAVRGARYTKTAGLAFGSSLTQAGLLSTTVANYSGGAGMADTSTLHCNDCHSTAWSSHGGANEYMLQTATAENPAGEHTGPTDYVCIKCHVNGSYNGGTGNHVGNGGDYVHTSGNTGTARAGSNGHITGIACLNCHDGAVGFGGIHGVPNATYTAGAGGSGQGTYNKRRFMPGSGLRYYDPSTADTTGADSAWETATADNKCYTLGGATAASACTKHGTGTNKNARNVRRPVTY